MIHSKRQKWVSILFSFVVMCVTAILGFVGLVQPAKPFSVLADDETATTATYAKVKESPEDWSGEYLIVYESGNVIFDGSLTKLDATKNNVSVKITNDTISVDEKYAFTIASVTGGYSILANNGKYIGATSNSNSLTDSDTALVNTLSMDGENITIKSSGGAYLRYNNQSNQTRFRYYKSSSYSSQQAIQLYKKVETSCDHILPDNATPTQNEDGKTHTVTGTCTECGAENVTKTVDCVATGEVKYSANGDGTHTVSGSCVCGRTISGTTENCAIDRTKGVTYTKNADGTHTENGKCACGSDVVGETTECTYTNGVCSECGNSAPSCTISYSVWGATTATDTATKGSLYTLKTENDFPAAYGTFVGWAESEVTGSVQAKPTVCTEYTVTGDKTFYAVFQGKGLGGGDYEKVTENLSDWSGEYLIVCEAKNIIFDGSLDSLDSQKNQKEITISDNKIAATEDISKSTFSIVAMDGGYSVQSKSGYYIGLKSGDKGLDTDKNNPLVNSISVDSEKATITSSKGYVQYNASGTRFRYYSSNQTAIQLYKQAAGTVTAVYYTQLAATIDSASVSLGGDIGVNYFAKVWDDSVSSLQMRFTVGEGTPTAVNGEKQADGRYKFTLSLTPQCMADTIKAELWNGEACIDVKDSFSVREYAKTLLESDESSSELKALLSEMLRYGAAAQTYQNYNTENLATDGVESLLTAASATEIPAASFSPVTASGVTKDDCAVWIKGAGIRFDSENKIYVRLSGALPEGYTLTCGGVEMTASEDSYFYTAAISPKFYGNNYEFVLKNGEKVLQTLSGSINACLSMATNAASATEADKALALALYNYGVAASAYVA